MHHRCPEGWQLLDGGPGEDGFMAAFNRHGVRFRVVASWGQGWDHVSVSTPHRCPTWDEMCYVKGLMFDVNECAVQYHPPEHDYVNFHPHCLHLWSPQSGLMPTPPWWMVGPKDD